MVRYSSAVFVALLAVSASWATLLYHATGFEYKQLPDESPAPGDFGWPQPTSITRRSQTNYHINSHTGICD